MRKFCFIIFSAAVLFACQQQKPVEKSVEKPSDKIYQYSLFTALANKVYDGDLTVAGVLEKGNLGLGTFNGLNGEMIVCDGVVYQFLADGTVRKPENTDLVPFTVVTFFDEDLSLQLPAVESYDSLKAFIQSKLPSENRGYAFKIKGNFTYLKCGSAHRQEKPFTKNLSDALVDRPVFETENISGTMVGFWYPEYTGKINVAGFHLHFISDDKMVAGHVMEFKATDLKIGIDVCNGFEIVLPETADFQNTSFDLNQEYSNPVPSK
jgi:acetolactate decarboxylase